MLSKDKYIIKKNKKSNIKISLLFRYKLKIDNIYNIIIYSYR